MRIVIGLALVIAWLSSIQAAEVYRCEDPDGLITYADRRCEDLSGLADAPHTGTPDPPKTSKPETDKLPAVSSSPRRPRPDDIERELESW